MGTGGALRLAIPLLASDPVLVLNGDSYCEADLPAMLDWHREHRAEATLLLTRVPDTRRYGRVTLDQHGGVRRVRGKGKRRRAGLDQCGHLFDQSPASGDHPDHRRRVAGARGLSGWIGRGLFGCPAEGRFLDIGTPESYAAADSFFANQDAKRP